MENWIVFRNQENNQELCAYTVRGTFPGERANTIELLAAEHNLRKEQIITTIEKRK